MDASTNNDAALAAVRGDLAALRSDVGALVANLQKKTRNGASDAADQISGTVKGLSETAADSGQQSAKAIGAWIEEKPLLAFLIAVGVGYVGVRALLR
jgi:ABC-type transporter Mla subunit MlaD